MARNPFGGGTGSSTATTAGPQAADVRLASYLTAQAKKHYEGALSQQTAFTWIQKTTGIGYRVAPVWFDAKFTAEPVFAPGSALLSITAGDYIPFANAIVMYWTRDPKNGLYIGATVALSVELRYTPGFVYKNAATGSSVPPVPTVAHHLTFSGPTITLIPKANTTPKKTGMTP